MKARIRQILNSVILVFWLALLQRKTTLVEKTVKELSESQPRKLLEHLALKFLATMRIWTLLSFYWSPQNKFSYADLKAKMSSTRQTVKNKKFLQVFLRGNCSCASIADLFLVLISKERGLLSKIFIIQIRLTLSERERRKRECVIVSGCALIFTI